MVEQNVSGQKWERPREKKSDHNAPTTRRVYVWLTSHTHHQMVDTMGLAQLLRNKTKENNKKCNNKKRKTILTRVNNIARTNKMIFCSQCPVAIPLQEAQTDYTVQTCMYMLSVALNE